MKVQTEGGLIDHLLMEVRDVVQYGKNSRTIATEWHYKGKLVRRDVWVNVLRAPSVGVKNGE